MDGLQTAPAFSALPTSLWVVFSMEAGAGAIEVRGYVQGWTVFSMEAGAGAIEVRG